MKRDHICFAILLFLLLIAPEVPLGVIHISGPELSSFSIAFIGLLFWLLISPMSILRLRKRLSWGVLVVFFALYGWMISLISGNLLSILYSLQYFFYTILGFLIIRTYFLKSLKLNEFHKISQVFIIIGIFFSLGILVSVIIGPIYPHQTQWTQRMVEDIFIQRGVGFTENPNVAGGIQIFFLAASIFLYPSGARYQRIATAIMAFGLLLTLSRSAILSFIAAALALVCIWFMRAMLAGKINYRLAYRLTTYVFLVCIIPIILMALFQGDFGALGPDPSGKIILGLGLSNYASIGEDASTRLELWNCGIRNWINQGALEAFFGVGFHNSNILNEYGVFSTPHNFYVNVLGDFGVVGFFFIFLALMGPLAKACSKLFANPKRSGIFSFSFLTIASLCIHNMTGEFLYSQKYILLFLFSILVLEVE